MFIRPNGQAFTYSVVVESMLACLVIAQCRLFCLCVAKMSEDLLNIIRIRKERMMLIYYGVGAKNKQAVK